MDTNDSHHTETSSHRGGHVRAIQPMGVTQPTGGRPAHRLLYYCIPLLACVGFEDFTPIKQLYSGVEPRYPHTPRETLMHADSGATRREQTGGLVYCDCSHRMFRSSVVIRCLQHHCKGDFRRVPYLNYLGDNKESQSGPTATVLQNALNSTNRECTNSEWTR